MSLRVIALMTAAAMLVAAGLSAQTTYRLRGSVHDDTGAPVTGARVRAEAINGFRGEQFVGQKEFVTTTDAKGGWTILGLTGGMWAFEATAPDRAPRVVVLPVHFTQRQMISAKGGQLGWELPLILTRASDELLQKAIEAAAAGRSDEAVQHAAALLGHTDLHTVCAAGDVALLVRQHGLADALFGDVLQRDATHPCGMLGTASAALMQNDWSRGAKMIWGARDVAPRPLRRALGAAIDDLRQITAVQ